MTSKLLEALRPFAERYTEGEQTWATMGYSGEEITHVKIKHCKAAREAYEALTTEAPQVTGELRALRKTETYDQKSFDLAEHFLQDFPMASELHKHALAVKIQKAVEDWFEDIETPKAERETK